jgi:hypothetical protein
LDTAFADGIDRVDVEAIDDDYESPPGDSRANAAALGGPAPREPTELESLVDLARSQLDLSLSRLLKRPQ